MFSEVWTLNLNLDRLDGLDVCDEGFFDTLRRTDGIRLCELTNLSFPLCTLRQTENAFAFAFVGTKLIQTLSRCLTSRHLLVRVDRVDVDVSVHSGRSVSFGLAVLISLAGLVQSATPCACRKVKKRYGQNCLSHLLTSWRFRSGSPFG